MPVPTTTDDLLELIRKSELVPAERLDTFMSQSGSSAAKPRELSNLLVAAGLVTQFQAEQFLQGKWRGFAIGKYKVLERLGSGGMGTVYLCEHMVVCRKVAVKVLPTSQANNPSALGRFYREARAAGVLDHPNLVKAHDVDQEGPLHFLIMDYVDGASLQEIVTRFGPLSVTRACHYIRQAATGLQAAHEAGLIHRDVKPANIMLQRDGTIRLLDLGLARFTNDNLDLLTLKYDEKNVLGTADYVAPEQALNSHEVDIRCDIYGLGGTFYYLLTGSPPFPGGKIAQKLIWHQVRQPAPVRQTRSDVPEELEAIVARMMAKDPAKRFQSPQEVIEALAPWTKTPVPPPRDEEMPRLSPAAAGPGSGAMTPSRPQIRLPRRSSNPATAQRPAVAVETGSSGHVSTLHRAPPVAEIATPRHLAASQTTTATAQPRPATAPSPRGLGQPSVAFENAPGSVVRLALLSLVSGLAGGLLLWLMLR
jgi:serine/threonine protein kinase